jgi:hypothetical protein
MAKRHKTWTEKRDGGKPPQVKPAPLDFAGMKKGEIMLIPTGKLIDDFIRAIPKGTGMDQKELRRQLAEQNGAQVSCPITTGILLRIVVEAANEEHEQGKPIAKMTPVWRVLDEKAPTVKKLSFDPAYLFEQRRREGL